MTLSTYNRGAKKDQQKAEALKHKFHKLESKIDLQQAEIESLKNILQTIESSSKTPATPLNAA